jgi:hypothetical protein
MYVRTNEWRWTRWRVREATIGSLSLTCDAEEGTIETVVSAPPKGKKSWGEDESDEEGAM